MGKTTPAFLLYALLASVPFTMADDGPTTPLSISRQFPSHGTIHMNLTGGDYSICAAATDEIHVMATAEYPADPGRLQADIVIRGSQATIVTGGPHINTHFTIAVPRRSNLLIRLEAGTIQIEKIEGNLDVNNHAGDVYVRLARASDYRSVDASVYAGDLNAPAFGTSKSGMFRSIHWTGSGAYRLRAHLGAGELNLEAAE